LLGEAMSNLLVIECSEELVGLLSLSSGSGDYLLDFIDNDAVVGQVIDTLSEKENIDQELPLLCKYMAYGEGLAEDICFTENERVRIYNAIYNLATGLKNTFSQLNLYSGNVLPYNFKRVLNDSELLFVRYDART
jgi:hypothetical protein